MMTAITIVSGYMIKPEDSFRDHSEFLKRPRYAKLFQLDKNDYVGWANGLKAAGYATNPNYPQSADHYHPKI